MAIALNLFEKDLTKIVQAVYELVQGRANNVTPDTSLTPGSTTTVVKFANCSMTCAPVPVPLTAHAAAEWGNGTMYISDISNGSFTVTHANNAQADRTFRFVCAGG